MAFHRCFDVSKIKTLSGGNMELYQRIFDDIKSGDIFPAVRVDRLDFYHGGGVLFSFSGNSFKRNPDYDGNESEAKKGGGAVAEQTYGKSFNGNYEFFKECNRKRFRSSANEDSERKFLDGFYGGTYKGYSFPSVCVLDIEVRINEEGNQKKCDMVLLGTEGGKNRIMFVEAKLKGNSELRCAVGRTPKVVTQVEGYTAQLNKHKEIIEQQYLNYLDVMSRLIFKKPYNKTCDGMELIPNAKLLIFGKPKDTVMTNNQKYSEQILKERLDVLWANADIRLSDIWDAFALL